LDSDPRNIPVPLRRAVGAPEPAARIFERVGIKPDAQG
jgi:hypothetical protein